MDTEAMTLDVAGWVNDRAVDLADLRGRVVLIEVFQMLCPGCVSHGIPQALRVHRGFSRDDVVVLGLHSVFEHHEVMGPDALEAFVSEYKIGFPVAIDRPVDGRSVPSTMGRYGLQGTPTTLLVDRAGRLRHSILGSLDDLTLGTHIGRLISETPRSLQFDDGPADLTDKSNKSGPADPTDKSNKSSPADSTDSSDPTDGADGAGGVCRPGLDCD